MRILIGTPIHECKDYAMARWLESVSRLDYPFDLLMVDNSPDAEYLNKVHEYCQKYRLTNYKLVHIAARQEPIYLDERLAASREIIRAEVLSKDYDAWFSFECDILTPPNTLTQMVDLIGDYSIVRHCYPSRGSLGEFNQELGLTLVKQAVLKRYGFESGLVDPINPNTMYGSDVWFIVQIDRSQDEKDKVVSGIIKPIYHLSS